jgi:hypothetical protein
MEEALIIAWHKVKAALALIEEQLGYVPETVQADSGSNGPPPNHN